MYVIQKERTAIGVTRVMKSAAMGEDTVTAEMEKEIVTATQTVRGVTSVGRTTALGGMEMTAACRKDGKMLGVCVCD